MKILLTQRERELLKRYQELSRTDQDRILEYIRNKKSDDDVLYYRGYTPHYARG